jgi:hypothetical protein
MLRKIYANQSISDWLSMAKDCSNIPGKETGYWVPHCLASQEAMGLMAGLPTKQQDVS